MDYTVWLEDTLKAWRGAPAWRWSSMSTAPHRMQVGAPVSVPAPYEAWIDAGGGVYVINVDEAGRKGEGGR